MSKAGGNRTVRGRVIARTGDTLLVRTRSGDVRLRGAFECEPGDLIEHVVGSPAKVVRSYLRGDYPTPETETARLAPRRVRHLEKRARSLASVRRFFNERDFLEIEAPLLVPAPGLEVHIDAVPAGMDQWLITSPEFQMKRLLAAGLERIYTLCKCFRAGESGAHHSVEFTMIEWYRSWSDIDAIAEDTEQLVARVADEVAGTHLLELPGGAVDVKPPWVRMTVAEALSRFAGVDVAGDEDAGVLAERVRSADIELGTATAWDDIFYTAFVARVEPALQAIDRAVLLTDWPVKLSALARRKPSDDRVVERFEAYVGGIELANAFGELTDPLEQRARFVDDQLTREERGRPVYPIDEKLIAALEEGLPPSGGIALGFDRLCMLVSGARDIRDVLPFGPNEL